MVAERTAADRDQRLPEFVVGLDVETTALDPTAGDIIEVAAIRYDFASGQEVGRFERLLSPRQPLTEEITALTGITPAMVAGMPAFAAVREELRDFIGENTIIFAHNANFDTAWLAEHGLRLTNPVWDTFLLASVAWPEASSYNLGYLARELGVEPGAEHRAAADVTMAHELLRRIKPTVSGDGVDWSQVQSLLQLAGLAHYAALFPMAIVAADESGSTPTLLSPAKKVEPDLADMEKPAWLEESVAAVLGEGGRLSRHIPGFVPRPEQLLMAETVDEWFTNGLIGLVEADTGTGKTFGYLVPALRQVQADQRVVISTYTRHLQDQLLEKDIPALVAALGMAVTVAVLKGRRNYVCTERLRHLLTSLQKRAALGRGAAFAFGEAFFLIKILVWLGRGGSGDLDRLNISHQGGQLLRRLHADSVVCRQNCTVGSTCPYLRARRAAQQAAVVIINHALLVRVGLGEESWFGKVTLVVDEAHHLEAAARHAAMVDFSLERVQDLVDGLIELSITSAGSKAPTGEAGGGALAEHLQSEGSSLLQDWQALLEAGAGFVNQVSKGDRVWLSPMVRRGSAWQSVVKLGEAYMGRLKFTLGLARGLRGKGTARVQSQLDQLLHEGERMSLELTQYLVGNNERAQWVELGLQSATAPARGRLRDTVIDVSPIVTSLMGGVRGAVLTSATLTASGSFAYVAARLGLPDAPTLKLGSSFNYHEQMLIYLVDDSPLPSSSNFDEYTANLTVQITNLLQGRLLGLFTSKKSVKNVYDMVIRDLNRENIKLFAQGITGGRKNMLGRFRALDRSVLLGTTSFWEGVDIPGEGLSCVLIPRLPFAPPDDPLMSAEAAARGVHPFFDLAVPVMLLKLRQGLGRLLRSSFDCGVIVILDPRIHQHEYGRQVIDSLPPGKIHIGSGRDVVEKMTAWFGPETIGRWQREGEEKRRT